MAIWDRLHAPMILLEKITIAWGALSADVTAEVFDFSGVLFRFYYSFFFAGGRVQLPPRPGCLLIFHVV